MYTQEVNKSFKIRTDLSVQKRFLIAYIVLYQYTWGCITRLARKNNVSRQFIYQTVEVFCSYCQDYFEHTKKEAGVEISPLKFILSHRMEGKCSIPSISTIMQRQNLPNHSVGYISQALFQIGKKIGNTLNIEHIEGFTFSICSDEIFANQTPILITVDPVSFLILNIELSDNRKSNAWINHWRDIKSQRINLALLINDEGLGMKSAMEVEMPGIERQSDTFHAVAHRLGLYSNRLETSAYKAIGLEYECERLFKNAKTEITQDKRLENYNQAQFVAQRAIELYTNFNFLYHCLLECFQSFDQNGKLKDVQKVIGDFDTALEYIKELENKEINDEVKSIQQCKTDLFTFYKSAEKITASLSQSIDNDILKLLSVAWQCNKNSIKAKNSYRRNKLVRREQYILKDVKELIDNEYEITKQTVYDQLNQIIQSSAAVECINSLLRPYLNTSKNQVTQEFLNLFMFYHNHRRFANGKRKGKTPMEIATMTDNQLDWLELLLQKTEMN